MRSTNLVLEPAKAVGKILIVDDDASCASFLSKFLSREGHEISTASGAHEAAEKGMAFSPDLLLTDWVLNDGLDGVWVARKLREVFPSMPVIFITGLPKDTLQREIAGITNARILEKPLDIDGLLSWVHEAFST